MIVSPAIYRHISDDNSPKIQDFAIPDRDDVRYLAVKSDGELLGIWAFIGADSVWEIHTAMLPSAYGHVRSAARRMLEWLWENSPCAEVTTKVPIMNRLALALAKSAGMKEYGIEEESFVKNGIKHDQILLAISRPEKT